ncbi:hypothetical protein BpHYR1_051697 [Brachionus plicatilis]|uniref:Uncharacterized protein n=1 Tax=Brachionus plicatilis TaxID=10195 RepID=A0A3M7SZZ7_BRAPC|nr:hypothetical protein BpHYR1_051697 [Brachionus plicatilis]
MLGIAKKRMLCDEIICVQVNLIFYIGPRWTVKTVLKDRPSRRSRPLRSAFLLYFEQTIQLDFSTDIFIFNFSSNSFNYPCFLNLTLGLTYVSLEKENARRQLID